MKRALLLNADWSPLHFIDEEEAIYLLYLNKAKMIHIEDGKPSQWPEGHNLVDGGVFPAGATLALNEYVAKKWKQPRYRRRVLFNRDGWKCQYCGCKVTPSSATVDHVYPSSKGGTTTWMNCVTSCTACNARKKNRTPEEAGMKLIKKPTSPSPLHFWDIHRSGGEFHPDWVHFLPRSEAT